MGFSKIVVKLYCLLNSMAGQVSDINNYLLRVVQKFLQDSTIFYRLTRIHFENTIELFKILQYSTDSTIFYRFILGLFNNYSGFYNILQYSIDSPEYCRI